MDNNSGCDSESSGKKPKTGKFKQTSSRLRDGKKSRISHRASLDWRQDHERVCTPGQVMLAPASIDDIKTLILRSRTGGVLINDVLMRGLEICYDRQTAHSQFYPREEGCFITINPQRPTGDIVNLVVRELRRAWQFYNGAFYNPMSFEPDDAILVNRAQQADAFIMSVKIAWELKLLGEAEAWNYMVGSPYVGVTRTFETLAQDDFRSLNNGEAARAAYDKFFEGATTKQCDKRIIHQMLLDDAGYMKAPKKPPRATAELFRQLGEMPQGSNYLSIKGKRTPTDQAYATIEDRSNANFLWFIKFERSFQEKELEMLKESVRVSAEIVDFATWSLSARREKSDRQQ